MAVNEDEDVTDTGPQEVGVSWSDYGCGVSRTWNALQDLRR